MTSCAVPVAVRRLMSTRTALASGTAARAILLMSAFVAAQAQTKPAVSFELASIKPSKDTDFRRSEVKLLPSGRLVATNFPLQVLIAAAYRLPYQSPRLIGGPGWVRSDRFDIEAKAASDAIPNVVPAVEKRTRMLLMLQNLLADRFKLVMHREVKELPVYAMAVSKEGLKLLRAKIGEDDCFDADHSNQQDLGNISCHAIAGGQGYGLHAKAIDMSDLAVYIENFTDRPVIDKTGVTGLYQIDTKGWVPLRLKQALPGQKAEDGSDLDSMPSLFAIFGSFGLKLEAQKGPVEIFTIEHVERPTGN
jgi:uncharacterized protein (TIGR03435 family)